MTSFARTPGIAVAEGDRLRLTAVYNGKRRWPSVMGIMLGAFVPDEAATGMAYAFSAPDLG